MTPSPAPLPGVPWIVIDGPLIAVPEGGWQVLISVVALLVSAGTLIYTLTARPRVSATVQRHTYRDDNGVQVPDGDDVSVMNLGRASVIVRSVDAIGPDGTESRAPKALRGPKRETVIAPSFPLVIEPGKVVTIWMPVALYGATASYEHGFKVSHLTRALIRRQPRTRTLIVRGGNAPAKTSRTRPPD